MRLIQTFFNNKIVPRWTIFVFDLTVAIIAFVLAYVVYYKGNINAFSGELFAQEFIFCLPVTAFSFFMFKLYSGIIRYTSAVDSIRILSTILFNIIIIFSIKLLLLVLNIPTVLPNNLVIIFSLFLFTGLTIYRTLIQLFFNYTKTMSGNRINVVVYGAGDLGIAVKRAYEHDLKSNKYIVAYIDDDPGKIDKSIDGVKIYSSKMLPNIILKTDISELIIASHNIDPENKEAIVDICLEENINLLTLPPVHDIVNNNITPTQIKKIKIEDLLDRPPIQISNDFITEQLEGKRILVTGAAGSIGSEIATQLSKYKPKLIILCDQAESPLHNLRLDLEEKYPEQNFHTFIADVKNQERMRLLFSTFKPNYVYHAAAYKHVPMMEEHPIEGVSTNIFGTFTLANLAVEFGVKKFVFVSTDKAVNPTNVMGATKRVAEIYVQALNHKITESGTSQTRFITTRFGNVLGSNGSVIPRFKEQIQKGGPVTVTHPDITRYFMTIPEACQLVIEAGSMGNGGEIFVFDMGKSVKIVDLAKKMIQLSGFTPHKDIEIKFTGLRPGEKLYEELLNDMENTITTHHQKIMIAKVRENDFDAVNAEISVLHNAVKTQNNQSIVGQLKIIVPEFKSKNSIYEKLDEDLSNLSI